MEPPHALAKYPIPVKITCLEHCTCFVRTVVEDHRWACAITSVTVNRGYIGAVDTVVLKSFEVRLYTHFPDPGFNQFTNAIINHGAGDAGIEAKAIGQTGCDIVVPAGDVNFNRAGFAEGDHTGVKAMYKGSEGQKVQLAVISTNIQ